MALGRDFTGVVVGKGLNVRENIKVGDEVWGVMPPPQPGSLVEYACVNADHVRWHNAFNSISFLSKQICFQLTHKPKNLSATEAASILYAGVTALSGLRSGGLAGLSGAHNSQGGGNGTKVCILGASGGVGSMAVQIAKAENVEVVAVCSTSAIPTVEKLGADHIVDYTNENAEQQLASYGPYKIILDCAAKGTDYAGQTLCTYDQYITFTSPLMRNVDYYGLAGGIIMSAASLIRDNVCSLVKRRAFIKWAYFSPTPQAIEYLTKLAETNKVGATAQLSP